MATIFIIVIIIINIIVIPAAPFCSTNSVNCPTQSKMVPARSLPTTSRRPQSPSHPSPILRSRASALPTPLTPCRGDGDEDAVSGPQWTTGSFPAKDGREDGYFSGETC